MEIFDKLKSFFGLGGGTKEIGHSEKPASWINSDTLTWRRPGESNESFFSRAHSKRRRNRPRARTKTEPKHIVKRDI